MMPGVDVLDRDGRSQLHMAAHANDAGRVAELIAAGADLNLQDKEMGLTPLHLAAQEYAVDAARVLLEAGASVDVVNEHGNSPLFVATFNSHGRGELIELLREHGANPDLVNQHGQTPRRLAELIGNYDVAQFFTD
jgi:ankyrin repeat protein